jgi:phosphorylase kinase alpha/beta subunit
VLPSRPPVIPDPLDRLHHQVRRVILARQHPVTGLLPASTAINAHGDYTDAWVRDVVYGLLAPWGLALAYRRVDAHADRRYELEHAVVRGFRGLLGAMMRQADKVEAFKANQDPRNALHAKYATATGMPVVGDAAWGHLQVDATALFLLQLAQVTASGLPIVQSEVEVRFVQNLVHYVGNAYRSPDFGIWERGDKANQGRVELNASSVALAKAALEALDGFDLFGAAGGQRSVVHVAPDDVARARLVLEAMLPRESASKEVDAALLAAVGYPAFAVDEPALAERTRREVVARLRGRHGLKRFLRDGHQTPLEDPTRLHYEPEELARFEGIEAEWPLFEAYLALDAAFRGDAPAMAAHRARLAELAVERDGLPLLPELYTLPADEIEAERAAPGSRPRRPNDNVPLLWAQSLAWLAEMLDEGLIDPSDLDPLGRHLGVQRPRGPVVQVALLATDDDVRGAFADLGAPSQTLAQVAPVRVRRADGLMAAWARVGACPTLGLSGRPARRPGALATARVYRLRGDPYLFLPVATDPGSSIGAHDPAWLAQRIRAEIAFLHRHARGTGRPTLAVLLRPEHLGSGNEALLALVADLRARRVDGVPVRLDRLATLLPTAASERIDDLGDWIDDAAVKLAPPSGEGRLRRGADETPLAPDAALAIEREGRPELVARVVGSDGLEQQAAALAELARRDGIDALVPLAGGRSARVGELLDEVDAAAAERGAWGVMRTVAGVRDRLDPAFVDALDDLLVAQKRVVLAKGYSEGSVLMRPVPVAELRERLRTFGSGDLRDRSLTQEIVVVLADLARADPERFRGVLTLRVGALVALLAAQLAAESDLTPDEGHERLVNLSPAEVAARLDGVLARGEDLTSRLRARERLTLSGGAIRWQPPAVAGAADAPPPGGWWRWRQREGALNRVPTGFYARVWTLLGHARGLVIGDKLDRRHRIDAAAVRAATTAGEKNFALRVEHLLHRIPAPEYRHLSVEALATMADVVAHDPGVRLDGDLVVDVLVGHAVRRAWLAAVGEAGRERYDADTAAAWAAFYDRSPVDVAGWFVEALRSLVRPSEGESVG